MPRIIDSNDKNLIGDKGKSIEESKKNEPADLI